MNRPRSFFGIVVGSIVVAVVFIPTLTISIWKVLHGRGAESYLNVYGLAIHHTSVLILAIVMVLIMGGAYVARIIHFWRYGEASAIREQTPYTDPGDSK